MWPDSQGIHLILPLVLDPVVDHLGREDVAGDALDERGRRAVVLKGAVGDIAGADQDGISGNG